MNYVFEIETNQYQNLRGSTYLILSFFALNMLVYILACLLQSMFTKNFEYLNNLNFWFTISFGFILLALDRSFYVPQEFCLKIGIVFCSFWSLNAKYIFGLIIILLPFYVLYKMHSHKSMASFYGMDLHVSKMRSYFYVVPILVLIILIGSYSKGFQSYYPFFSRTGYEGPLKYMGFSLTELIAIFESLYLMNFIKVEFFFRGFLVIGMMHFLKKDVILPMVAVYVILHFGKPVEETITSAFGGFLIGIVAYYSKNIWGGIIWHISIAASMEIFAYYQKYL